MSESYCTFYLKRPAAQAGPPHSIWGLISPGGGGGDLLPRTRVVSGPVLLHVLPTFHLQINCIRINLHTQLHPQTHTLTEMIRCLFPVGMKWDWWDISGECIHSFLYFLLLHIFSLWPLVYFSFCRKPIFYWVAKPFIHFFWCHSNANCATFM